MTAHGSDNMASWFPGSLSESQILEINEKAIPINRKKATKFGLGVFQGKFLFLNIILHVRLNFAREAEIVMLTRNNCQLSSLFTNFKIRHKNIKIVIFTSLIHWFVYVNVIIQLSFVGKPSIFTFTSVNNCSPKCPLRYMYVTIP